MAKKEMASGTKLSFCEGYVEGKMQQKLLMSVGEIHLTRKLQLVHSDVAMWANAYRINCRKKVLVTFIDDYLFKVLCCLFYEAKIRSAREIQRI